MTGLNAPIGLPCDAREYPANVGRAALSPSSLMTDAQSEPGPGQERRLAGIVIISAWTPNSPGRKRGSGSRSTAIMVLPKTPRYDGNLIR